MKNINILILAQALEDLLHHELGEDITLDPTDEVEDILFSAEVYLSSYPQILKRILERKDLEEWLAKLKLAKADLIEQSKVQRKVI